MWYLTSVLLIAGALCTSQVAARVVCTNTTRVSASVADYLFLVDGSGSMCDKIAAVSSGLADFSTMVSRSKIQARYAIVRYGGTPKILLPFVSEVSTARDILNGMGCGANGQESAFEALRGSISPKNGADFLKGCPSGTASGGCLLKWNSTASKIIIMVTDEDSDLPNMASYMMPGQNSSISFCSDSGSYQADGTCTGGAMEPSFVPSKVIKVSSTKYAMFRTGPNMRLTDPYEAELELTASMLAKEGIFLNSVVSTLIGTSRSTIYVPTSAFNAYDSTYFRDNITDQWLADNVTVATYQFGHPGFQVQASNFSAFSADATYANLAAKGLGNSLQARMLKAGMYSRVFDIANFDGTANQAGVIQAFYNSIVETTAYLEQFCEVVSDAMTSTGLINSGTASAVASSSSARPTASAAQSSQQSSTTLSLKAARSTTILPNVTRTSSIAVVPTTSLLTTALMASSTERINDASQTASFSSSSETINNTIPTQLEVSAITENPTEESPKIGTILGAVLGGLVAVTVAAAFLIHKKRAMGGLKQAQSGSDTLGATNVNPLYEDKFGFKENPLFHSKGSLNDMNLGSMSHLTGDAA